MEHRSKSASILTIITILNLLLLTSCADTPLPTWFTGEPEESVLTAPRVVGSPPGRLDPSYPNLATVPEKPKDFSTQKERKASITTMSEDKTEAQDIKERLDTLPGVDSVPAPPSSSLPGSFSQLPAALSEGAKP